MGLRFLIQFRSCQPKGLAQEILRYSLRPWHKTDPSFPWCSHFLIQGKREAVWKRRGGRKEVEGMRSYRQVVEDGCKVMGELSMLRPLYTGEEGWGQSVAWVMETLVKETHSSP